ncbi:sulfurtransferase complex subunit TusB [Halomonas sp. CUBES01]|uniref:sulfurtransferase complex subunit TusB n=1 Tax=Halomonas sp. CUBES01 TaxID=2897340 RepID=UPI001E608E19|nr:sulfurtransferase complex subunit TusB [Halomonas sp. CUBES01]MEC4767354.1 sulfurtransferase complex subunit TusB [Halomonas sp. CUBES01]
MTLHILTTAPNSDPARQVEQALNAGDTLLLIEAAVTAALDPQLNCWTQPAYTVWLLEEDLVARGLGNIAKKHRLATVNMDGFVALTEQHEQSVTWY